MTYKLYKGIHAKNLSDPQYITAFGLACGLFVIFKINMVEPGSGIYTVLNTSALLLLVAAFADLLDGAVARAFHAESEFGVMFDSLADAISLAWHLLCYC